MRSLLLCFLLIISFQLQAQDSTKSSLVRQYYKALNEKKSAKFYTLCYQYDSHQEFYKEAYRTFYYRAQYKVEYDLDELREIELLGGYENDTVKVQYGKYRIHEWIPIGTDNRDEAYSNLNQLYNTHRENNTVDQLSILRKVTYVRYEYEPGKIKGLGEEYFIFITTKNTGKTKLIPFDLLQSYALTQVLEFEFILEAFQLTTNNCNAALQDMNQLGEDVFNAIQTNTWLDVYCQYGITAEVEDSTGNYEFGRDNYFSNLQNEFLHELHVRQDIVRVNISRVHRKMKDRSPRLHMIHLIEQEENGKQFMNVLIEVKIDSEFEYILVVCQKKWNGWRINNGPLLKFYGEPILNYIKKLKRK